MLHGVIQKVKVTGFCIIYKLLSASGIRMTSYVHR